MNQKIIESSKNPRIKAAFRLRKKHERDKTGLMIIEGSREIIQALDADVPITELFFCPDPATGEEQERIIGRLRGLGTSVFEVRRRVIEKLIVRAGTGFAIAIAEQSSHSLDALPSTEPSLFLVVESVEKPGNLGAMLRSADAAGATGIILCDPRTDLYNPNVIRSSLGTVFTVPSAIAASDEAISWLENRNISIFVTALSGETPYTQVDLTGPGAIVVGSEDRGVSESWLKSAGEKIVIPMRGKADSLNVSAAAAVILFEALRQRSAVCQ